MQVLIDKLMASGIDVMVAYIPPAFNLDGTPNATRNQYIQEYNAVIAAGDQYPLHGHRVGPDLFTFFRNTVGNGASMYADELHPNGLGTRLLAYLWRNSIVSASSLPLFLRSLSPLAYKQDLIELQDKCYTDNAWVVTQIPSALNGGIWIKTANADRTNTSGTYITFGIDRDVVVNVAYDASATLPTWLDPAVSSFQDTGRQIRTTAGTYRVYSRSYASSQSPVVLGGNHAGGGTGNMNYIVIVQAQ